MIHYKLDMYTDNGFKFIFDDGRYTLIDLAKNYKNYREPCHIIGEKNWHFTVETVDPNLEMFHKNIYKVGDVLYFDRNGSCNLVTKSGVGFKKTTQSELDYYEYKTKQNTDNARVYKSIKNLFGTNIRETTL